MIKKIDEKSHQTQQSQNCISFNASLAVFIHFLQLMKSYRIHFALSTTKLLRKEIFTDSKYSGLKKGKIFLLDDPVLYKKNYQN